MSRHVLLIGHPERYAQFLGWLCERGYRVTLTSPDAEGPPLPPGMTRLKADLLGDFEGATAAVRARHAEDPFDGVFSHNEFYQVAADQLAARLGLPHREPEAVRAATHKLRMKELFRQAGVPTAEFTPVDLAGRLEDEARRLEKVIGYPMVIKPTNGCLSIGVRRVDDRAGLVAAIRMARRIASLIRSSSADPESRRYLLAERYVHGAEFTVDGFVVGGRWHPLASCSKYPDLFGPTFQENVYLFSPSEGRPVAPDLAEAAAAAVRAFALDETPFHIEIRREEATGRCFVVEAAPRMAGMGSTFYNILLHASGFDAYDLAVRQRMGERPALEALRYEHDTLEFDSVATRGGRIARLRGLEAILAHEGLRHADILMREGDVLAPPELNLETIAVFYFRTTSRSESMRLVHWIEETFSIECE